VSGFRTARYLFAEGFRAVRRHPALSVSAVIAMTASLIVLGVFLVISVNVKAVLDSLQGRKEIVVYLKPAIPSETRLRIEQRLREIPGVADVRYVSPEEAWDQFTAEMSGEGLLDEVGENPLPASFELALAPERRELAGIEAIASEVGGWDEVDEVAYGGAWVSQLDKLARRLLWLNIGVGLAVALAVVAVVANTIRLTVIAKRDMIEIMKMVGASEWFIRLPFLYEGAIQAAGASLVSLGILYAATISASDRFGGLTFFSLPQSLLFVGAGLFLGLAGSYVALRQILKEIAL
jgi:cell division transport system permease protein